MRRTPSADAPRRILDTGSTLRAVVVALGVLALVAATTIVSGAPRAAGAAASVPLGFYAGGINPAGVRADGAATGTDPVYGEDFASCDTWADMTGSGGSWLWNAWNGSGLTLVLGMCPWPGEADTVNGQSVSASQNLANGAAGQFNSHWVSLGQQLVANNESDAVLRFGWEFNGGWEGWTPTDAADAANFAASFRQFVTSMRSVPGAHFTFDWNPAMGWTSYPLSDAYPGNAYVDYVGLDVYDNTWDGTCMNNSFDNSSTPAQSNCVWDDDTLAGSNGLDWLTSFAAANGKPMSVPEWGVDIRTDGHGLGDDPTFIDNMASWLAGHDVAFDSYFDTDPSDGQHCLQDAAFPRSLAAFDADFGAGGSAPTTSAPTTSAPTTTAPTTTSPPPTTSPTTTTTAPTTTTSPTTTTTAPTTTTSPTTTTTLPSGSVPSPVSGRGWTFNGSAHVSGPALDLNGQSAYQAGSAVYDRPVASANLRVEFDMTFSNGSGANGMTVALLPAGTASSSLGIDGSGLGFSGLAGTAATFDTFPNGQLGHRVGVSDGAGPDWGSLRFVTSDTAGVPALHASTTRVLVTYHNGHLAVWVGGQRLLDPAVAIPSQVTLAFTGATGYFDDAHSLSGISISH